MADPGVVLWDFDGTLAERPGRWGACLIETLDDHEPGHGVDRDTIRPYLRDGFPWHRPEQPHPELCEPDAWWSPVEAVLAAACERVGVAPERAVELARLTRTRYVDPTLGWRLFDDTVPVLRELADAGWSHVILSNHVPELPALVDALGLTPLVPLVLGSAATGYEKPHPRAFELALEACGQPDRVWMVGDNPVADVDGAEAAGIPAILVRTDRGDRPRVARDLHAVRDIVCGPSPPGATLRSIQ